jgi:hypothetical protein
MCVMDILTHAVEGDLPPAPLAGSLLGMPSGYGPARSSIPAMPGSIRPAMRRA